MQVEADSYYKPPLAKRRFPPDFNLPHLQSHGRRVFLGSRSCVYAQTRLEGGVAAGCHGGNVGPRRPGDLTGQSVAR